MPLKIPVLVRGINNLSDARYCAGMGADGLIFTLDPLLPGAVTPELVKELAGWVAGVELIGEFGDMPSEEINALVAQCGLNRVLISFLKKRETPGPLAGPALVELHQMTVLDDRYSHQALTQAQTALPAGFEFVTRTPAAQPGIAGIYAAAARNFPLWLSGPLEPAWAVEIARTIRPAGLILQGGDEIKPGLRDFTELEAIFEVLEAD